MTVDHPFAPYPDGRRAGCVRCPWPQDAHPKPEPSPHLARDPGWERALTDAAASGIVDATSLSDFSDERAHDGPWLDFFTRDWDLAGLEEGADWRSYIACSVRRLLLAGADPGGPAVTARMRALGHVAAAFSLIEQARGA